MLKDSKDQQQRDTSGCKRLCIRLPQGMTTMIRSNQRYPESGLVWFEGFCRADGGILWVAGDPSSPNLCCGLAWLRLQRQPATASIIESTMPDDEQDHLVESSPAPAEQHDDEQHALNAICALRARVPLFKGVVLTDAG